MLRSLTVHMNYHFDTLHDHCIYTALIGEFLLQVQIWGGDTHIIQTTLGADAPNESLTMNVVLIYFQFLNRVSVKISYSDCTIQEN